MLLQAGCTMPGKMDKTGAIKDMLGREVQLPDTIRKVVGLRAGALRLLVYMDAAAMVSGIEEVEKRDGRPYIMAHPKLQKLPVIGPVMGGDAELLAVNKPDVIFITYTTHSAADELQQKTGIPVIGLKCGNLKDKRDTLYHALKLIGKVLNKKPRADSLIAFINQNINKLNQLSNRKEKEQPRVYVGGIAYSGAHGITSTEPHYAPFRFLNARNVASSVDKTLISPIKGTYIDKEKLIEWDPGYLFIDISGLDLVMPDIKKGAPLAKTLQAIQNNQVYTVMPYNWYATNYEIVLANAWFIGKTIYPQRFAKTDAEKEARKIYKTMVGKDVYDQVKKQFGSYKQLWHE